MKNIYMIKIGLVGLPNVGKSSFFKLFTKTEEELVANYPFATINPNIRMMDIPDHRLERLAKDFQSKKITFSTIQLIDIAGLVKDASKGRGLGNKFLANIREVDLICHMIRCFKDENVEHVENNVDPIRDWKIIQLELILADLQQIEKKIEKLQKFRPETRKEKEILENLKAKLLENIPVYQISLSQEEKETISNYHLLTAKPNIIIANYNQEEELKEIIEYANRNNLFIFPLSIRKENSIIKGTKSRKNLNSQLEALTKKIKESLNLKVFFTVGSKEAKSWLARTEMNAKQCAGLIHTDIGNRLIRTKIYNYYKWIEGSSETTNEKVNYIIKEGDICNFLT